MQYTVRARTIWSLQEEERLAQRSGLRHSVVSSLLQIPTTQVPFFPLSKAKHHSECCFARSDRLDKRLPKPTLKKPKTTKTTTTTQTSCVDTECVTSEASCARSLTRRLLLAAVSNCVEAEGEGSDRIGSGRRSVTFLSLSFHSNECLNERIHADRSSVPRCTNYRVIEEVQYTIALTVDVTACSGAHEDCWRVDLSCPLNSKLETQSRSISCAKELRASQGKRASIPCFLDLSLRRSMTKTKNFSFVVMTSRLLVFFTLCSDHGYLLARINTLLLYILLPNQFHFTRC